MDNLSAQQKLMGNMQATSAELPVSYTHLRAHET